ncbi:MAG: hypothetical protein HFG80_05715 [Eubacterium sp.]|nr:hypothetical protein [Eubacterium sp.]
MQFPDHSCDKRDLWGGLFWPGKNHLLTKRTFLFLRHHALTPDALKIRMITPGGTVEYDIHVIKSQQYTLKKFFEKKLLLLIPFYIFSHESQFKEYEQNNAKLRALQEEYEQIKNELENLLKQGSISEYTRCTIIDMSNKVLEHIAVKYNSVKEGVKAIMVGKILEYEAKTIKREGIEGTVSILKNLGIPSQTILDKIQEQYNLSPEASRKYL